MSLNEVDPPQHLTAKIRSAALNGTELYLSSYEAAALARLLEPVTNDNHQSAHAAQIAGKLDDASFAEMLRRQAQRRAI